MVLEHVLGRGLEVVVGPVRASLVLEALLVTDDVGGDEVLLVVVDEAVVFVLGAVEAFGLDGLFEMGVFLALGERDLLQFSSRLTRRGHVLVVVLVEVAAVV